MIFQLIFRNDGAFFLLMTKFSESYFAYIVSFTEGTSQIFVGFVSKRDVDLALSDLNIASVRSRVELKIALLSGKELICDSPIAS